MTHESVHVKKVELPVNWLLGTLFYYGYGLGWGLGFALLKRWSGLPSLVLGGLVGGLIYLIAFSQVGVGAKTNTSWRKFDWLARRFRL